MWTAIGDLFQRNTLLQKLEARRRINLARRVYSKKEIAFISPVRQLSDELKAMEGLLDNQEIDMAILCGFSQRIRPPSRGN